MKLRKWNNDFQYIAPKYNYPLSDRKNDCGGDGGGVAMALRKKKSVINMSNSIM